MKNLSFLIPIVAVIIMNVVCDKDHSKNDPCEGLPLDSCQVDTCTADSCLPDTCIGDTCSTDSCSGLVGQWEFIGLAGETVSAIALHPSDVRVIFVGTAYNFSDGIQSKLFKTRNCGTTWDTLLIGGTGFTDIDIDPTNPNVIYAVPHEIMKSTDGGNTWVNASQGIFLDAETRALEMVIDPNNTGTLYAGTGGFFGGNLYKSTNGGENWTSIGSRIELQGSNTALAIDAQNNIIYVGHNNGGVLKSFNNGLTWDTTAITYWGHSVKQLFVDPETGLYTCIGALGIWNSTDAGDSWSNLNAGLDSFVSVKVTKTPNTDKMFALAYRIGIEWTLFTKQVNDSSWSKFKVLQNSPLLNSNDFVVTGDFRHILVGPSGLYRYTFP